MKEFNSFQHNSTTKILRENRQRMLYVMLFFILFSNSIFRNEQNLKNLITISLVICVCTFFVVLHKPSKILKTMTNSFTLWLIVIFAMYFIYGMILTSFNHFDADYFFFMFIMILVTILLFIDIPFSTMMEIFIKVCSFASFAICFYILINEWTLIITGNIRIGESGSGNVNTVAIYLGLMSIPSIYKVFFERKYSYLIPYIFSIVIMFLTGSKKSLIFIFFGVYFFSILRYRLKLYKYILPTSIILAFIIFIFNNGYLYGILGHRVVDFIGSIGFSLEGAKYSHSTELRIIMYKTGYNAFITKPIFGGGWFYYSSYSGLGTYSHNNYIELLVTYGMVGFFIYYIMFFALLLRLKNIIKSNNYAKLIFTLIIAILVNDFAAVTFSFNILNYQILALGYIFLKGIKKSQNKKVKEEVDL